MAKPKMQSLWDEVFPTDCDFCDNTITAVLDPSETDGRFELVFDVFPFAEGDMEKPTISKKLVATGAYCLGPKVFRQADRSVIVGQAIKEILVYPAIIRFDIVTTGALRRLECETYDFQLAE
ncbi:MAG: hypothetical protein KDK28_15670 [Maritimibacter sp.]|nr:hypothetical protein [Maritimibacter sp.]